jgi:hypothetical protein
MFSNRPIRLVIVSVGIAILCIGAVLAGGEDNRPRTDPVTGTFSAFPQPNVRQRLCQGADGMYLEIRGKFAGSITSSDPRLTGNLEFNADALVNLTTGFGTFRGPFQITDSATGRPKVRGDFQTVVTEASLNHGFAIAKVLNRGNGPSEDLFANFKSTFDSNLNVTGQFGGTGDPRTPAVIQGGQCTSPLD